MEAVENPDAESLNDLNQQGSDSQVSAYKSEVSYQEVPELNKAEMFITPLAEYAESFTGELQVSFGSQKWIDETEIAEEGLHPNLEKAELCKKIAEKEGKPELISLTREHRVSSESLKWIDDTEVAAFSRSSQLTLPSAFKNTVFQFISYASYALSDE